MRLLKGSRRRLRMLGIVALIPLLATAIGLPQLRLSPALAANSAPPLELTWTSPSPAGTVAVAWGDIDNDGDLDLMLGNNGANESSQIYRNCKVRVAGDGCTTSAPFALKTATQLTTRAVSSIAMGDINGDGSLDVVLGSNGQTSQIFLNDGLGTFTKLADLPGNVTTSSVALGDLDGQGGLDLVRGNQGAPSQLFLNNGDGTFGSPTALATPPGTPSTRSVALGDLDGDGNLDIVLGNYNAESQVFLNDGSGSFGAGASLAGSTKVTSVALGDLDGQGGLDLALGVDGAPSQIRFNRNDGSGSFNSQPNLSVSSTTQSIALGDIDNDGDLDLVQGNNVASSVLYLNNSNGVFNKDAWLPPGTIQTYAVALGDADNDGALDLAMGNQNQVSLLYHNAGAALLFTSSPIPDTTPDATGIRQAALADFNNDGNFDLALSSNTAGTYIYTGDADGTFSEITNSALNSITSTSSLAWGDVENNGSLDLALGSYNGISSIYTNDGSGQLSKSSWQPAEGKASTNAITWADVDNDGRLDLLLATASQTSRLYLNSQLGLSVSATTRWQPLTANTTSAAWGDINNDGDLDLLIGNSSQPSQIYRNCIYPDRDFNCAGDTLLTLDTTWNPASNDTSAVAWGDLNGDGFLDIVLGNKNNRSQIYLNDGFGKLTLDTNWQPETANTRSVALGDMDGDQDIDLLLGNSGGASHVYRNDGQGRLTRMSADSDLGPTLGTTAAVWGDLDHNGSLDIILGATNFDVPTAAEVYLNGTSREVGPLNQTPQVTIAQPDTPAGSLLSMGRIIETPNIPISFTLSDWEADTVAMVRGFYSLDGGGTWQAAVGNNPDTTRNLAAPRDGKDHTFNWNTLDSGFFGQSDTVLFQIRAYPLAPGSSGSAGRQASGPYQRAFASATTTLFRARGGQIQVQQNSLPVSNAIVYRQAAGESYASLMASADGQPFRTNSKGYLAGRGTLATGDRLAALLPVAIKSTSVLSSNVELYYTSPISIASGLPETVVPTTSGSNIQLISVAQRPLALINLEVGLEWDASNDAQYINLLRYNLRRTSDLLYDWTNGQVALGTINVRYGSDAIKTANVHIYASNRLRPWARQGGIVSQPTLDNGNQQYLPGYLAIGAIWSRYGDSVSFGEDWPRALAHELGHYALFLDDNYIGRDATNGNQFINVTTCPGAMANPYREDWTEFHPDARWTVECDTTLSHVETQRSDWATIKNFYDNSASDFTLTQPGTFDTYPGPAAQVVNFTQINVVSPATSNAVLAPVFSLVQISDRSNPTATSRYTYTPGTRVRAMLYSLDPQDPKRITRVVDLGRPELDQVIARGAALGDRVCAYDMTQSLAGCVTVAAGVAQIKLYRQDGWAPNIQINPQRPNEFKVVVPIDGVALATQAKPTLTASFFSSELSKQPGPITLVSDGTNYSGTFTTASAVKSGVIHLSTTSDPGAPDWRESVADFYLIGTPHPATGTQQQSATLACIIGVDPGCNGAPLTTSSDGQVLIYSDPLSSGQFYSIQTATHTPPAPAWGMLAGQAYRLYTLMDRADLAANHTAMTIAYLESELPAGTEGGLAIYYSADNLVWQRLKTTRFDPDKNEISAVPVGTGVYALLSRVGVSAGWNNITYPWPTPFLIDRDTARTPVITISGLNARGRQNFTTIHSYEPEDVQAPLPWKVYDIDAPYWVNDLTQLSYGRGYWFIVPEYGALPSAYAQSALSIGMPTPPATIFATLPYHGASAADGAEVQVLNGNTVCNPAFGPTSPSDPNYHGVNHRTYKVDIDPQDPTKGQKVVFRVQVPPAGQLLPNGQPTPDGCGIPGQLLTVTVGGITIGPVIWDNSRPISFRDLYLPYVANPPVPLAAPGSNNGSSSGGSSNDPWDGQPVP